MHPQQLAQIFTVQQLLPGAPVEQALQRQIVQGAGLDTNLLELGDVSEPQMLAALGRALALPCASRQDIDASPMQLKQSFPLMFAETYHLVPYRLDDTTLHVLVTGPLDVKLAQRIDERLHLKLKAHITCEVRLHYAMHRLYGTKLLPRFAALLARLDNQPSRHDERAKSQPTGHAAEPAGADAAPTQRLGWGVSNARINPLRGQGGQGLTRQDFRSQMARLDAAQDRDAIVDIVLGFALALFDFAGLFVVLGGRVQGWRGIDPSSTRTLSTFDIELQTPSVFHTVEQTRGHYLGPMGAQLGNQALLAHLQRPAPQVALVAPIVVGGKVAAILYADNQARVVGPKKVAALLVLVQRCGLCFEQLIRHRKLTSAKQSQSHSTPQPQAALPLVPEGDNAAADTSGVAPLVPASFEVALQSPAEAHAGMRDANSHVALAPPWPQAACARIEPAVGAAAEPAQLPQANPLPKPVDSAELAAAPHTEDGWPEATPIGATEAPPSEATGLAAITVMHTPVAQRDLLFDGLEADDPAARQSAVAGLLALGDSIDAELSQRFPGPLSLDPLHTLPRELPPFAHLNGLTELIAARGQDAAHLVLPHLDSDDAVHRWAAVYFFSCVHFPTACQALSRRLYDTQPKIRTLAVDALSHYRAEASYQRIISGLREQLRVPVIETQIAAIQILGQLREPSAVPALIPLVVTPNALVARSAASALAVVCGQAYGADLRSWQTWWQSNYTRPRTDWLMGGLRHQNSTIRRVAHGELQRLTGQSMPFKSDASAPEQARLLEAWQTSLLPHDAP